MAASVFFVIRVSWNHPNDLPLARWQQTSERPFSHTSWLPKTTVFPTHPKNKQANAKQALPFPTVFFHRSPFLALQKFPPLGIPGNSGEPGMDDSTGGNHFIRTQGTWWKGFFVSHQFKGAGSGLGLTVFSYMDHQVGEHFFVHTSEKSHQKLTWISKMMVFEKKQGLDKDLSCCTAKETLAMLGELFATKRSHGW